MATVRMSRQLVYELKNKYKDSVLKKLHPIKELDSSLGDSLYNSTIGGKVASIKEALTNSLSGMGINIDQFFLKLSDMQVRTTHYTYKCAKKRDDDDRFIEDWEIKYDHDEHLVEFPLSGERSFPASATRYGSNPVVPELKREEYPDLDALLSMHEANSKQVAENQVNLNKFERFLSQFRTLNQALKAYPPLDKLVDSDRMAKIHKKQERKRDQEAQKERAVSMDQSTKLTEDILSASLLGDD